MGPGCVAGDGISADAYARFCSQESCNKATRFGYLLAALVYWIVFPHFRLARIVCRRRPAGATGYLHPRARARVSGLGTGGSRQAEESEESICGVFLQEHGSLLIYAALLMTAF